MIVDVMVKMVVVMAAVVLMVVVSSICWSQLLDNEIEN